MKLLRVGAPGAERPAVLSADGQARDVSGVVDDFGPAFFAGDGLARVAAAVEKGGLPPVTGRTGAPIARPGKVVCIGLNYTDHAAETGQAVPPRPVVFMKDPSTVVGPGDDVLIPRGSAKTDWEVELGVIIGRRARYLDSPEAALATVAGYAISNDVSERAFQLELSPQWDIGKSCETFNPLGPWLVTADEVPDPQALGLRLAVNGVRRQDGNTGNMVFAVGYLIWYLSQYMVLEPGDLINTGTPAGVALGLPDHPYLRPGDRVELEIDGLGRAEQRFVAVS
ncbi:MAG TPA: fumarylacetoacetate hydrolase family protein [Streptosporangiaceae bacterium]|jgi:2-keto-4-pentenoate hydratase/2-oxohepta-3-ene-1,7-dioic acid hydratase in catechol pathway|nr:fumarylacetoacetate hydrolase family protein [Streptosporangiaceae bacterium]